MSAIGLRTYAFHDRQKNDAIANEITDVFDATWELEQTGVEKLLADETTIDVIHDYLATASEWDDYPHDARRPERFECDPDGGDDDVRSLCGRVVKSRKGSGYAQRLVEFCSTEDLPPESSRRSNKSVASCRTSSRMKERTSWICSDHAPVDSPRPKMNNPEERSEFCDKQAELRDVEGLVKLVDRAEVAAHDWSLTPGRYVGVAPEEEDEDFDFVEGMRAIHMDLNELNEEAAELAARIARNF